uniref:Domain of unknown function at the cortex 1 domain-containing protein n=1 Tax=Ditylum brightwellii TaxID=49249 RepID=A0A7S1ZK45_9STRA|mmetsp:Transcript_3348/g.5102  ORF Transcript_3348/g.5102 Transcript_3348/m.5102 type:complete len:376 (+) Transcript_3348:140-1267(+)
MMRTKSVSRSMIGQGEKLLKRNCMAMGVTVASLLLATSIISETSYADARPRIKISTNTRWKQILEEFIKDKDYPFSRQIEKLGNKIFDNEITQEQQQSKIVKEPAAKFPSLQARLAIDKNDEMRLFQINSNEPIPFENDFFVGHVSLVLRPLDSHDDPKFAERLPSDDEFSTSTFWIQIEGRFKRQMRKDQVFVGAQLADTKMNLGSITRKVSDLFLRLLNSSAGGGKMFYSFGTEYESPHISFPLHSGIDVTKAGTENVQRSGKQAKITGKDHDSTPDEDLYWNTKDVYTMSYYAKSIDLARWSILLPFEFHLGKVWGKSDVQLVIYEQDTKSQDHKKNYLFNLQMKHLGIPHISQILSEGIMKTPPLATSPNN